MEDISFIDKDTWDIDLAEVVKVNALAVPADRKLTYRVMQNELRMLLSFLTDVPGSPLTLRHDDFRASSAHIKRLISESFGLGMLTAAAERHHRWKLKDTDLHNFDVLPTANCQLPTSLVTQYPSVGIRPDLLFDFTDQGQEKRLAGEARGRSSARPRHHVSKGQRERLEDIVAWSGVNDLHPVTMTYTYTGAANAQVDLFDIAAPEQSGTELAMIVADEKALVTTRSERRFERLSFTRQRAQVRIAEVADQLYQTAPADEPGTPRSIHGRSVRGS